MNIKAIIVSGLVRCFDFKTRSNRSEFWIFYIFTQIMSIIAYQIDMFFGLQLISINLSNDEILRIPGPAEIFIFFLFVFPLIALQVRRLHDLNFSGWWLMFIFMLPPIFTVTVNPTIEQLVLFIVLIFFLFLVVMSLKSFKGDNKYGPTIK